VVGTRGRLLVLRLLDEPGRVGAGARRRRRAREVAAGGEEQGERAGDPCEAGRFITAGDDSRGAGRKIRYKAPAMDVTSGTKLYLSAAAALHDLA
jgi:hypothetical protein